MHGWCSQVTRLFYWVLLANTKWCDGLIVYMYHFVKKDHLLWFIAVVNKWMLEESGWPWFILGKEPNHVMHSHLDKFKLRLTIISICTFHVDDCWTWSLKRIPDQLSFRLWDRRLVGTTPLSWFLLRSDLRIIFTWQDRNKKGSFFSSFFSFLLTLFLHKCYR